MGLERKRERRKERGKERKKERKGNGKGSRISSKRVARLASLPVYYAGEMRQQISRLTQHKAGSPHGF